MATQIYQSIHTAQDIDDGIVLQKTTENSQVGIRLLSENAANHGDIGQDAIDLSYSSNSSTTRGATGDNSFAIGDNTTASGIASIATGDTNTSSGTASFTSGASNIADGFGSAAFGTSTKSMNINSFCLGTFNDGTNSSTVFEVGIGANDATRKNALEILVDGKVIAPELTEALIINPRSLATKEYVDNNDSLSQLELINEGNGNGWRLLGTDPANYGNIGYKAVDFSISENTSSIYGATGQASFVIGEENTAFGGWSFASGNASEANGQTAHALGNSVIADGTSSFASGDLTKSYGNFSFTSGHFSEAHGEGSFAAGNSTTALNKGSVALGNLNIGTSLDTILEVGIGTVSKINAFEIYSDGRIHAPELTTGLVADPKSLITKEYLELTAPALNGSGTENFAALDLVLEGDLTVQGTTTTINTDTLQVEDKNIEMGKVTTPTDITADGGGITLLGDTNKTFIWSNATDSWVSNQSITASNFKGQADSVLIQDNSSIATSYPVVWNNNSGYLWDTASKFTFRPSDGLLTSSKFSGNGSLLVALNATNINSGTIGDNYLPASISSDITGNAATATTAAAVTDANVAQDSTFSTTTGFIKSDGDGTYSVDTSSKVDKIESVGTLTDGATVAVDMSTESNFELVTTQDFTLSNPTGLVAGQRGYISITQDATGSRLLTLDTNYKTIGGAGITLTTAASALDVLRYEVISATLIVVELLADIK